MTSTIDSLRRAIESDAAGPDEVSNVIDWAWAWSDRTADLPSRTHATVTPGRDTVTERGGPLIFHRGSEMLAIFSVVLREFHLTIV